MHTGLVQTSTSAPGLAAEEKRESCAEGKGFLTSITVTQEITLQRPRLQSR